VTDPRAALLPPQPAQAERGERVRVVLDGQRVTVDRDYLLIRRRSLIAELNAINESLGIRRESKHAGNIETRCGT
jgi:hypothetical protein